MAPVSAQALDDYYWCRIFGKVEGKSMAWKYGNPWRYPTDEFEQLKTIILTTFAADEFKLKLKDSAPVDVAAALNISEAEKEKAKKLSQSMADFFKGPLA